MFSQIAHGAVIRILIYEPGSDVQPARAREERNLPGQMQREIQATLLKIAEERKSLPTPARNNLNNLKVGLTHRMTHRAQIIRADERMLVVTYLTNKRGRPSPTMQLCGNASSFFQKYDEQFEILWGQTKKLEDKHFAQILQESQYRSDLPAED